MPEESDSSSELASLLDPAIEQLRRDLESQIAAKRTEWVEAGVGEQRKTIERGARAGAAESLLEAMRRIREEKSVTGIAVALVEAAGGFARRTALFIQKGDRLLGFRLMGANDADRQQALEQLEIPIVEASGLAHAIETSDTVVCGGGPGELGARLAEILGTSAEDRVHLFPIVLRDRVLAVLLADGDEESPVEQPAIEVLVSLAEAWLEAVGTRKKPVPQAEEALV